MNITETTTKMTRAEKPSITRAGFTLVELITVMGLIVLILMIVVPSAATMIRDSGESQSVNILSSNIALARTEALSRSEYVGVHVGLDDRMKDNELVSDRCYAAFVSGNFTDGNTIELRTLNDGDGDGDGDGGGRAVYAPTAFPEPFAFGQLSNTFLNNSATAPFVFNTGDYADSENDYESYSAKLKRPDILEDFTTFTILFSPQGNIMTEAAKITYPSGGDGMLFGNNPTAAGTLLWKPPVSDPPEALEDGALHPVLGVTPFNYKTFRYAPSWKDYLDNNAEFITFNSYTGHSFTRR